MEPSFVANPYVQAPAPSSYHIREMLERQEASYLVWRKTRKPVRLPYASKKLNNQLIPLANHCHSPNYTKLERISSKLFEASSTLSKGTATTKGVIHPILRETLKTPSSSITAAAKTLTDQGFSKKQTLLSQAGGRGQQEHDSEIAASRKLTQKQFHEYLYDFHSRQVFSFAKNEMEEAANSNCSEPSLLADEPVQGAKDGETNPPTSQQALNFAVGTSERQVDCILEDLSFSCQDDYNALFETDWRLGEVDKIVRDAVDRKRIRGSLQKSYRMLLWFFRFYAGNAAYAVASERRVGAGTALALGDGLFEIPSRLQLLDDLNVQCVDPVRYGITDSPLRREHLIDFLLNVARMLCTHSSNPNRVRVATNDGVEMSDAVKTLVRDHFGAFAQIQDVNHFRNLFLGRAARRLPLIIEQYQTILAGFFDNQISISANTRSDSLNRGLQRQRLHGLQCSQFLATLRAIKLILGTTISIPAEETSTGPTGVEEVRAVRIFLSCLPMTSVLKPTEPKGVEASTTASNTVGYLESRELTLAQFIEALVRVAFTWKELQICRGRVDVCPGQLSSDCCRCTCNSSQFDFDVLDSAVEEIFERISAYQHKRAQQRTSLRMKSKLVTTTALKPPMRLQPVEQKATSNDGDA